MRSNFDALREWSESAQSSRRAENAALIDARAACFYARRTLELLVRWLYDNDPALKRPYEDHLASLLAAPSFKQSVPPAIQAKARVIKELGNQAVHGRGVIRQADGLMAVRELWHVTYWFA